MVAFGESVVEEPALDGLAELGWERVLGPEIAPNMPAAEPGDYEEVVLGRRLREPRVPRVEVIG